MPGGECGSISARADPLRSGVGEARLSKAPTVLILNGPNLNLLGFREPHIYGRTTLDDIAAVCRRRGQELGLSIDFRQSNSEADLITWIQEARDSHAAIIINAGALSHSSIAILDSLQAVGLPTIEVHLSNIYRREPFRHHSYVSRIADGIICGLGARGYAMAVEAMAQILETQQEA